MAVERRRPVHGLAIFYDRANTQQIGFQGNGAVTITGTIYALKALLNWQGNSNNMTLNSAMIVDTFDLTGDGDMSSTSMTTRTSCP